VVVHQQTMARYASAIEFVAEKTGGKNVGNLERLATAIWVTHTDDERAKRIHLLKPHVSVEAAHLHEIEREAQGLGATSSPGVG